MEVCETCTSADTGLSPELSFIYIHYKVNYFFVICVGISVIYTVLNCWSGDFFRLYVRIIRKCRTIGIIGQPISRIIPVHKTAYSININIRNNIEDMKAYGKWKFSYAYY